MIRIAKNTDYRVSQYCVSCTVPCTGVSMHRSGPIIELQNVYGTRPSNAGTCWLNSMRLENFQSLGARAPMSPGTDFEHVLIAVSFNYILSNVQRYRLFVCQFI